MDETQERIYSLISRKVAKEATDAELSELEALLAAHPGLQYTLNMVEKLTPLPKPGDAATPDEQMRKERGLRKLDDLLGPEPVIRRRLPLKWLAAAGVALLAGISGALYIINGGNKPAVVQTAYGNAKKEVLLPDGSRVVLNAGSHLEYDSAALAQGHREVTLLGEAYFQVSASAEHPFVIKTGKVDVRVLGTSFNLKAYPKDQRVETYLYTGKVEVSYESAGSGRKVQVLLPKESLVVNLVQQAATPKVAVPRPLQTPQQVEDAVAEAPLEPAWMQGRLEFENVTFEQLVNDLERWYNVQIVLKNDQLKGEVFSGAFNNKPLPEVLQALQFTLPFQFKTGENNTVEIW